MKNNRSEYATWRSDGISMDFIEDLLKAFKNEVRVRRIQKIERLFKIKLKR